MTESLYPEPAGDTRQRLARRVRRNAARLRRALPHAAHHHNGDWRGPRESPMTFSKGLPHDRFGLAEPGPLQRLVRFINQARRPGGFRYPDPHGDELVLGPRDAESGVAGSAEARGYDHYQPDPAHGSLSAFNDTDTPVRGWESPLGGHVYDLEGPDADALTMPPAPALGTAELTAEIAEVYALALLRDVPFSVIEGGGAVADPVPGTPADVGLVVDALAKLPWYTDESDDPFEESRRRARLDHTGGITARNAFRGSTRGAMHGPYLSQFLLVGHLSRDTDATGTPRRERTDGYLRYGAQEIDMRVLPHARGVDYLSDWASWIDVQNGANYAGRDAHDAPRFIATPRDLASYVHVDQLYQAYLNACLMLFGHGHPFDRGLPEGPADRFRDPFATFGGPHLLSLLTEVASRALKFARRQKFNVHLRARPEALGGVLTLAADAANAEKLDPASRNAADAMLMELESCGLLDLVRARNAENTRDRSAADKDWIDEARNYLLPMAFPEGSPMHPSYAAGHASVAGACVTILKAFFEMFDGEGDELTFRSLYGDAGTGTAIYESNADGTALVEVGAARLVARGGGTADPTLLGELDKLAANISIGRDMAGVHYYTDYYESLRMGERVAIGILQEQMLCYPESVSMTLRTFDDELMVIRGEGDGKTVEITITKAGSTGEALDFEEWFARGERREAPAEGSTSGSGRIPGGTVPA